jgi:hypothetical protein
VLISTETCDPRVHEAAIAVARRCRFIIQAVLREEEWADADYEFYLVAREELERLLASINGSRETTTGSASL